MPSTPPDGQKQESRSSTPCPDKKPEPDKTPPRHNDLESSNDDATNSDPSAPLDAFDWTGLKARYDAMLQERSEEEQRIEDEFQRLMDVIGGH